MRVKIQDKFTGDILNLYSNIHPRPEALILHSGLITLIFEFRSIKLCDKEKVTMFFRKFMH